MARKAGAQVLALTATPSSRIARAADVIVDTTQPAFKDPEGMVIPGVRSFVANHVGLLLVALHLGEQRGRLTGEEVAQLRREINHLGDAIEATIEENDRKMNLYFAAVVLVMQLRCFPQPRFWKPAEMQPLARI